MTRYRTIVADPPWDMGATGLSAGVGMAARGKLKAVDMPYEPMTQAEIKSLPVRHIAADDAHLYLWTTQAFLPASFDVIRAWGFKISATLVWCKEPRGLHLGGTFAATVEFVHFCRRGSLPAKETVDRRWFTWPRKLGPPVGPGERRPYQATKPDAFLDLVEQVSPGPYLEMFARRGRLGWDYWGDESLQTVELPAA